MSPSLAFVAAISATSVVAQEDDHIGFVVPEACIEQAFKATLGNGVGYSSFNTGAELPLIYRYADNGENQSFARITTLQDNTLHSLQFCYGEDSFAACFAFNYYSDGRHEKGTAYDQGFESELESYAPAREGLDHLHDSLKVCALAM